MAEPWDAPSPRVVELMRAGAAQALADGGMLGALTAESVAALAPGILQDPTLAASMRTMTKGLVLHWLGQVLIDPGVPVQPVHLRTTAGYILDVQRRGIDLAAMTTYHTAHSLAWHHWMLRCFDLTRDPVELRELLAHSDRSISAFVMATMSDVGRTLRAQRWVLGDESNTERLAYVERVLDGSIVDLDSATVRLAHELRRHQTAAVLWHEPGVDAGRELRLAAVGMARAAGIAPPLVVVASAVSAWAWFATPTVPDLRRMAHAALDHPDVHVAVGSTSRGLDGFRRSHVDALTTQRLLFRAPGDLHWASYDEVQVVELVSSDVVGASEFVTRTLGDLATADPALHTTLRVYLREDASAASTARVLHAHRNTIINRVARAEALLPAGLRGNGLQVGLALEIIRWLGVQPGTDRP